jgi:serine/threonine protein phosphatase 1
MTRTFLISDIHGNNELFRKSLKQIGLKKTDKLLLLGDLIDRGSDSKGVLDTIFLLLDNGFEVDCLIGNHEKMLLDAYLNTNNLNLWLVNGGDKTLSSFLTGSIEKIPKKYQDFIKSFKYFIETDGFIFVHAALNMNIENPYSDTDTMLWEREPLKHLNDGWLKNRKLIHGHHPKSQDAILKSILNNEKVIGIDNGTYLKKEGYGTLCVLELETLNVKFIK